jgi:hypothetical protein
MTIRVSEAFGVNLSLEVCLLCREPRGVVLFGGMGTGRAEKMFGREMAETLEVASGDSVKAPDRVVMGRTACDKCKSHMKKGIILISVRAGPNEDRENPYYTGGWCVLKEEYIRRAVSSPEVLEDILKARVAFLPDETWDMLGLPRGPVEGVPSE